MVGRKVHPVVSIESRGFKESRDFKEYCGEMRSEELLSGHFNSFG
jgi:hypothetical protein